jgi:hypothetical protein
MVNFQTPGFSIQIKLCYSNPQIPRMKPKDEAPVLLRLGVQVHPSKGIHPAVEPGL